MNNAYEVYQIDTNNFDPYLELFKSAFPKSKQPICDQNSYQKYLHWLYQKNPSGSVVGFNAFFKDKLVGHFACIPMRWRQGARTFKCLYSLNTAVARDFQGQRIFSTLANKTFNLARELKYDFVYFVANKNSTHGFLKLGCEMIGALHMQVSLPFVQMERKEVITQSCIYNDLTDEFLKWRLSRPATCYQEEDSRIISNPSALPFNFVSKPNENKIFLGERNCKVRSNSFKIFIGSRKQHGFVTLPKWVRPVPLNFLFKNLNLKAKIFSSIENWNLDYLDIDLV